MIGKYELSMTTPMGPTSCVMHITEENGAYVITQTDKNGNNPVECAEVNGNKVTYCVTIKTPMGKMKQNMDLVVDGDVVTGKAKLAMGSMNISGKKID